MATADMRTLAVDASEIAVLSRDVVGRGGALWLCVRGSSMAPTIPSGSRVRFVPLPPGGPQRGQVVLAQLGANATVVHRVLARRGGTVALRGDNRTVDDPPISREQVIALVDQIDCGDGPRAPSRHPPVLWHLRGRVRGWLPSRRRTV
jgi:hypothetical protein